MPRVVPITSLLAQSRRVYAAASTTESAQVSTATAAPTAMKMANAAAEFGRLVTGKSAAVYWMRDPKTGNWIPENRFGEVDVAELRDRVLSKKK